jgi:hypothetical protein
MCESLHAGLGLSTSNMLYRYGCMFLGGLAGWVGGWVGGLNDNKLGPGPGFSGMGSSSMNRPMGMDMDAGGYMDEAG